jgi:hypothetical protein
MGRRATDGQTGDGGVKKVKISSVRTMRALSFFFALMVGLVLAFLAPAMAGGEAMAPEPMMAPETSLEDAASADSLDALAADLLASPDLETPAGIDAVA